MYNAMQMLFCVIKECLPYIQYIFVIIGVVVACVQLHYNTVAQQDRHSPCLVVHCPKGLDFINGLEVCNVGSCFATNINIKVYQLKRFLFFAYWKFYRKEQYAILSDEEEKNIEKIFKDSKDFCPNEVDRIKIPCRQ
jgi:hypothetical protein